MLDSEMCCCSAPVNINMLILDFASVLDHNTGCTLYHDLFTL